MQCANLVFSFVCFAEHMIFVFFKKLVEALITTSYMLL